jgi:hypothetical protein
MLEKDKVSYNGKLTGTIDQNGLTPSTEDEFGASLDGIQQVFRVNPADEEDYQGTIGYKDA